LLSLSRAGLQEIRPGARPCCLAPPGSREDLVSRALEVYGPVCRL